MTADFDAAAARDEVIAALRPLGSPSRAAQEKRYLKSSLDFLGVDLPSLRGVVVTASRAYGALSPAEVVAWATSLWDSPLFESRAAAVEVLRGTSRC